MWEATINAALGGKPIRFDNKGEAVKFLVERGYCHAFNDNWYLGVNHAIVKEVK